MTIPTSNFKDGLGRKKSAVDPVGHKIIAIDKTFILHPDNPQFFISDSDGTSVLFKVLIDEAHEAMYQYREIDSTLDVLFKIEVNGVYCFYIDDDHETGLPAEIYDYCVKNPECTSLEIDIRGSQSVITLTPVLLVKQNKRGENKELLTFGEWETVYVDNDSYESDIFRCIARVEKYIMQNPGNDYKFSILRNGFSIMDITSLDLVHISEDLIGKYHKKIKYARTMGGKLKWVIAVTQMETPEAPTKNTRYVRPVEGEDELTEQILGEQVLDENENEEGWSDAEQDRYENELFMVNMEKWEKKDLGVSPYKELFGKELEDANEFLAAGERGEEPKAEEAKCEEPKAEEAKGEEPKAELEAEEPSHFLDKTYFDLPYDHAVIREWGQQMDLDQFATVGEAGKAYYKVSDSLYVEVNNELNIQTLTLFKLSPETPHLSELALLSKSTIIEKAEPLNLARRSNLGAVRLDYED